MKNKRILVVGLGRSGKSAVRFLRKRGVCVTTTDSPLGKHPLSLFASCDGIVLSPGVPPNLPGLVHARRRGVPVIGEMGLAALYLKSPLVAVTGTNGKSTTATLTARLLEAGGFRTALAGNIGRPLLEVVMERRPYDWVVAEVSSYQLETVERFAPRVSLLLNITPDHLDRYRSFSDYAKAKARIFRDQGPRDLLVYNAEDPVARRLAGQALAGHLPFSSARPLPRGLFVRRREIIYRKADDSKERYSTERFKIRGTHNLENAMAAIGAARFCGVETASIRRGLARFRGLPHRTETVRTKNGVLYINDSKGTNVDAVVKTLAGFPAGRVLLIAGGLDKGSSYRPLARPVRERVRRLFLIGKAAPRIARGLKGCAPIENCGTLARAVRKAAAVARPGDVVLLSPACASFDQFRNFEERGKKFREQVNAL